MRETEEEEEGARLFLGIIVITMMIFFWAPPPPLSLFRPSLCPRSINAGQVGHEEEDDGS